MELDELNDHDDDESEEIQAFRALRRLRERGQLFQRADSFHSRILEEQKFWEAIRFDTGEFSTKLVTTDDVRSPQNYVSVIKNNPHGIVNLAGYSLVPIKDEDKKSRLDYRSQRFLTRMSKWPPICIFANWLLKSTAFEIVMISVIMANSILVATDQELNQEAKTMEVQSAFEALDFFFLFMFVSEIILKWLDNFTTFWYDGWNVFDFLITSLSLVAPFLDVVYPDTDEEDQLEDILTVVRYLRIVRILRSLNVVTRIHKIELIWSAVLQTFTSLIFITSLMFIFFFIFAIIGMQVFERYSLTHKATDRRHQKMMYRKSFQTLEDSFVTLFQLFTLDHWYELLIEVAEVMGWGIPTVYILTWILIGSFIFRNIFVGVMVNNFQVIREDLIKESENYQKSQSLAKRINVFAIDHIEKEVSKQIKNPDPLMDWESGVFHTLEIVKAITKVQSPTMWPRDTLYAYYVLLEALASNTDEKHELLQLLENDLARLSDG